MSANTSTVPQLDSQWILDHLVSREAFEPAPHPAKNRDAWENLPDPLRDAFTQWADEHMDYTWPHVRASDAMAYGRTANRVAFEKPFFERRMALQYFVMAECMTWQGKYIDKIIDGIWTICEEAYWCLPCHAGAGANNLLPDLEDPILDLFAGCTGQTMAWTVWLLGDKLDAVSPEICKLIRHKVKHFVLDAIINHPRHWLGLDPKHVMNNWTPWICATWLSSAWILEDEPAKFEQAVKSICRSLNIFMSQQPADGGCDEGVMYWPQAGGALYECLDQLGGMTGGNALLMDYPLIQNLAKYPQVMHVKQHEFVCFADGRAYARTMHGYWINKWGRDIDDASLIAFGDELARHELPIQWQSHHNFYRQIQRPFLYQQILADTPKHSSAQLDHWLPDVQVMTARQHPVCGQGWHLSAKGRHNAESHNHNDVGQFVVYHDAHPMFIDLGVETYTGKTFGPNRYDIFTMQSQWHNLLTFGNAAQLPGREYAAKDLQWDRQGELTSLSMDIADAYGNDAGLQQYTRTVQLDRDADCVHMRDQFVLDKSAKVTLSLITVSDVQVNDQALILSPTQLPNDRIAAGGMVTWEGVTFDEIVVEEKVIEDPVMKSSWDVVRRIQLTVNAAQQGDWQLTMRHA